MILTQRDKILFEKLLSYAVMTTRQIAQNIFADVQLTTVLRRLRKLEKEKYICRNAGLATYEQAWTLTEKGSKLVSTRPPKWHQSRFLLEHDTKLTAVRLALENIGVAQSWIPEHEIRYKVAAKHGLEGAKKRLIPDGIMGVEVQGLRESVAIELELHGKSSSRYRHNFYDYKNKESLFGVWYIVSTSILAKQIERYWHMEVGKKERPRFFWSEVDEVIPNPADAFIHSNKTSTPLAKSWAAKVLNNPAHPSAHGVGKASEIKVVLQDEASDRNNNEILGPNNQQENRCKC